MKEKTIICKNTQKRGEKDKNDRSSNLALYRIIVMLLIVAHHYVVNSGLMDGKGSIYTDPLSAKSIFYEIFGAWGKTGINCFVLITGYFMCTSNITAKKFVKLIAEVMFYKVLIATIFWIGGYEQFTVQLLFKTFVPIQKVQQNFTGCYLMFFLFIPFLNILIRQLNKREHLRLLALCAFTYVFWGTFHKVSMNYVSWYMVLFVIGAYIRLYPKVLFDKTVMWGLFTLVSIAVSILSIICCAWFGDKFGIDNVYWFVSDCNTFLAVATGVCSFIFFKNLRIPQSKFINTVANSTFGVLMIHANSDTMRRWLWKDVLDNVGAYSTSYFIFHAIGSVVGIFSICIVIDRFRICFLEPLILNKIFWEFQGANG